MQFDLVSNKHNTRHTWRQYHGLDMDRFLYEIGSTACPIYPMTIKDPLELPWWLHVHSYYHQYHKNLMLHHIFTDPDHIFSHTNRPDLMDWWDRYLLLSQDWQNWYSGISDNTNVVQKSDSIDHFYNMCNDNYPSLVSNSCIKQLKNH